MKNAIKLFALILLFGSQYSFSQEDAVYRITIDADPLVKQVNGRDLPGEAQVRVVLRGRDDEVVGGKLANGIIPSIVIDEEIDLGKVREVDVTLNGIGWTKSVTIRNIKVKKTVGDESKTYQFPCGCPLTQGNQTVHLDAGGAVGFQADREVIQQEEMDEFSFEGTFPNNDVSGRGFVLSKREIPTESKKTGETVTEKTSNRICTTQQVNASASFSLNFLTNPTENAIYPGALIYAEDLASGSFSNIKTGKDRAPVEISTSSAVMGVPALTVENPSLSQVRKAMNEIMINQDRGALDVQANFDISEVSSKEELSISLGGRFESATVTANVDFNFDSNSEKTMKVVKFVQKYYTMDIDQPGSPEEVFTNPKDALEVLNSGKTPLYVSQVTFGRIAYFFMETSLSEQDIKAHLDGEYRSVATVGAEADLAHSMKRGETKIKALIIGGNSSGSISAVDGYEGFLEMLRDGGQLDEKSLGVPVSYTLRFLSDNSIARTNITTNYPKRTCRNVDNPNKKVILTVHKITNTPDSGHDANPVSGKFEASLWLGGNKLISNMMSRSIFSEDHPGPTSSELELGYKSEPVEIDIRKLDEYLLSIFFKATESDSGAFDVNDTNNESKVVRLKDVFSVDKQSAMNPTDMSTISVRVDNQFYKLHYTIHVDE